MIVTNSLELNKYTKKKTAVALGSFDALHKGHLAIINEMTAFAKEQDLLALVQLFESPVKAKEADAGEINTLEKRLLVLESLGADIVVVEDFTEEFRKVDYRDFVSEYLAEKYNAAAVFAGDNYRFGHRAEGDVAKLESECLKYGIRTKIIPCIEQHGIISSTRIRDLIKQGDVKKAEELMTRPYSVSGEVVHGRGLGRMLGFPTANINIPKGMIVPKNGVYLTRVSIDGKTYDGITNLGAKPTVAVEEVNIETYITGFGGDIYGRTIEVEFRKRLRDIKKFSNLEELKEQLDKDIKLIED